MRTKLRIVLGVALAAGVSLVPSAAHAKGAASAQLSGPGLDEPIQIGSWEASGGESQVSASELGDVAGLYAVAFGETPGGIAARRPEGRLGARYVVKYRFMVGQDENLEYEYETIRQELYPFARGGPVSYTPPGQQLFDRSVTDGWYSAGRELKDTLVAAGLPASPPRRAAVSSR